MKFYLRNCIFLAILFIVMMTHAVAQTAPVPPKPEPPKTMEEGLKTVRWDATKRGVLLALDPQLPMDIFDRADANASVLIPDAGGYTLPSLAEYFKRMPHRFGGVTVLAPTTMVVLNPRPGEPIIEKKGADKRKIKQLLATFTPAQWQLVGGSTGIGFGDMRAAQQKIYDLMLENPFVVSRMTREEYERRIWPLLRAPYEAAPKRVLTPAERGAIRLRIKLASWVNARFEDTNDSSPLYYDPSRRTDDPVLVNVSDAVAGKEVPESGKYEPERFTSGVHLSTNEPNHLKPSDLKFDDFPAVVSLESDPKEPLTVGMLMTRIADANRIALTCDKRLARVRVWVRGTDAVSGDLLKSVCLAIGGAIRRVGQTYLLTSDLQGLAIRRAVVDEWQVSVHDKRFVDDEHRAEEQIAKSNAEQYILLDENDPIKPPPARIKQMLAKTDMKDGLLGIVVKSEELSPAAIAYLDAQEKKRKPVENSTAPRRTGSYVIYVTNWTSFLVPGMGEIEGDSLFISLKPSPPPDPFIAKNKQVLLHPATAEEAQSAVLGLAKRGAAAAWIVAPLTPTGEAVLKAAIMTGRRAKLPIYAAVHVLRRETTNAPESLLDCNIRGEASGWLAPDLPQTASLMTTAVAHLAKTPGLSGIVLFDLFPPGYRGRKVDPSDGNLTPAVTNSATDQQGYRFAHRTAFLAEQGADPIDIVPYSFFPETPVPFFLPFRGADSLADTWAAWRNDRALPLVSTIRKTIESAKPGLPVLVQGEMVADYAAPDAYRWFMSWAAEPLPHIFYGGFYPNKPIAPQVRGKAKTFYVVRSGGGKPLDYQKDPDTTGADGTVLDFSSVPVKEAINQLEKLEDPKNRKETAP